MASAKLCVLAGVIGSLLGATSLACAPPSPDKSPSLRRASGSPDENANEDEINAGDDDEGQLPPGQTPGPGPETPPAPDADGDGIPDADDCDPASSALAGTRLLDDPLATDRAFFTAADGFPQASWSYDGTAYRQGRLGDVADLSLFNRDPLIGDVIVDVRAASTEITDTITPVLRQMFIMVGLTVNGGSISGLGCGVEVVGGLTPTQRTSVVRLSGPPGAVVTSPIQRISRAALQVNEEFSVRARLAGGTLTCEAVVGGTTTTAIGTDLGAPKGSVGFFTRQSKALFKNAKICKLK